MEARAEHPGAGSLNQVRAERRLVGIDLGTTNSAVAWMEATARVFSAQPALFAIPQLVASNEVAPHATLPSFLYLPTLEERATGALALPWEPDPGAIAGVFARDHGALVPARLISSAKSWLSNPSVDRRAELLPWTLEPSSKMSPVDASARLLRHLREAWDYAQARDDDSLRLERQAIVLTVPASFDEEARELTVEAASRVGLDRLTLLEEPLAALYAWMASHRGDMGRMLAGGQIVLVCDVGGGTTDFSLIRSEENAGGIQFERTAIGEHLLLGGDNVDLALAALVERKLADAAPAAPRLSLTQRQALRRQCSSAKERLLTPDAPGHVQVTVLGGGRGVVGGTVSTALTRDEVTSVLHEFLPITGAEDRPARDRRPALRELGLPYEGDPAITRHLAAFLARAARTTPSLHPTESSMARPDAVLFNGGFFTPLLARERVLDALAAWFGERPAVLHSERPEAAVAVGAAFFAALRRDQSAARRLLVLAGSARAYYVGVQDGGGSDSVSAVCVMPRGTQEGTRLDLDREFTVIANQPAAFTLYSSVERDDPPNARVTFTPDDDVHRHAPLVTSLRYGKRSRRVPLTVGLSIVFTEVGTLELWCESRTSGHRWRLQFNLRTRRRDEDDGTEPHAQTDTSASQVVVPDEALTTAERLLRGTFGSSREGPAPEALVGELENALGHGKHAWPLPTIRRLADLLLELAEGRRASARHEARWLNLVGFCMRPGFGTPVDPWRVTELRKVYATDLIHPKEVQNQVEWLVVWQRVAGGFTASQQQELGRRLIGLLGLGARKGPHLNSQIVREAWRLLGSLERLNASERAKLGDELLTRVRRDPQNAALLWALGRFGARTPFHGPLNSVVAPPVAERWVDGLLALKAFTPDTAAAVAQIGARTDDPARDISDKVREAAVQRLQSGAASPDTIIVLQEFVPAERLDAARMFGETLPEGLRLHDGS